MFTESHSWYDPVYEAQGKDYAAESAKLRTLFESHGRTAPVLGRRPRWMDVACGTGRHLEHLPDHDRMGVDLDPGMLELARRRCPGVDFEVADMRHLGRDDPRSPSSLGPGIRFDIVTCLFSAIAYMRDIDELDRSIASMSDRLLDGGMLLVEPFLTPEAVVEGRPWMTVIDRDDLKLARMDVPRLDGRRLDLEFHYLIATSEGVEHRIEPHRITVFTIDEIGDAFRRAGLEWEHQPVGLSGRGLHLGIRP